MSDDINEIDSAGLEPDKSEGVKLNVPAASQGIAELQAGQRYNENDSAQRVLARMLLQLHSGRSLRTFVLMCSYSGREQLQEERDDNDPARSEWG